MIGYIGVSLLLTAMIWGEYKPRGVLYYALNSAGSLTLLTYASLNGDTPVFILNLVWVAVSLLGLVKETK